MAANLKEEFKNRVLESEGPIDLARAGLLVSRLAYADLDEQMALTELDRLAAGLRARTGGLADARSIAETMGEVLSVEEGFRGDSRNYYDPDNSYLNRVLEKRTGIPITLSIVYMEVGRRAGVDVRGIGIPGHFIAAVYSGEDRILLDPFYRGAILDEEQCRRRALVHYRGDLVFSPRYLRPLDAKEILVRLLRNLRGIYSGAGENMKAFQALEWIIALAPDAAAELKIRGLMYESLGAFDLAVKDLEKFLALQPAAPDAMHIQSAIDRLKEKRTMIQ